MKRALALLFLAVGALGAAQELPVPTVRPIKIQVMHADPWFVVAMLEGRPVVSPEISTILGFMGVPPQAGQALNQLFKGKFIVNAADNSIWFIPDRGSR